MLIAMGISGLVLAGAATLITMAATSLSGTTSQTFINYRSSSSSEFIFSRIRFASQVDNAWDVTGNTLRVGIDEDLTVDSGGDKITWNDKDHYEIFEVQAVNVPGTSSWDNRLIYFPRENQGQTVVLIASGIRPLPGKPIFTITNGATVLVNFAVVDTYARDGYQTCDIQGAAVLRNCAFSTNVVTSIP
jgi:hypothetical protein